MDTQSSSTPVPKKSTAIAREQKRKERHHHPLDDLPFTALRDGEQLPKYAAGQLPRCFWHVAPTGNYTADCKTGEFFALQWLKYEEDHGDQGCLNSIVADMPREMSGIEHGFMIMVGFAAKAGAYRAREISNYWARCEEKANG